MQRLEVNGAVRLISRSLGVKGLIVTTIHRCELLTTPSSATYLDEYPDIRDP